eukprot:2785423-Prymnesium_polylepis.4
MTYASSPVRLILSAGNVCTTRTGAISCALNAGARSGTSRAGTHSAHEAHVERLHPGCSRRASYRSPS